MYCNLAIFIMIANLSPRLVSSFVVSNTCKLSRATGLSFPKVSHGHNPLFQNTKFSGIHGGLFMSTDGEGEKTLESTWDVTELKKEAGRLTLRTHKKIGKASMRLTKANEIVEELRSDPDATVEQLNACPDIKTLENDLNDMRDRLTKLTELEEKLQSVKSGKSVVLPEDVASIAMAIGVNDAAPERQQRGPKKKKGPRIETPRMPYFTYTSKNNIEIRVSNQFDLYTCAL
jgi:DNA-binding transcriptional regulator GbsR (MarR family)